MMGMTACSLDYVNPNAASEDQVLSSPDGLVALVNGIKSRYTSGGASPVYSAISAAGLSTGELFVINAGNADLAQLNNGGTNVSPNNSVVTNMWRGLNLVRADAEKLIDNAKIINDPGTSVGVIAYGHFFKGLALGTMAQFWEQAPLNTAEDAAFSSRQDVLREAVKLLSDAATLLAGQALSANFTSKVGTHIDILNTCNALAARYSLMLGNYNEAIAFANKVDLAKKSEFRFDNVTQNPVYRSSLVNNNTYDVVSAPPFGLKDALAAADADGRKAFYLTPNATNGKGFFTADAASIPVYIPGEMLLIKAEALARTDKIAEAIAELDKVLTKTTDIYGVNANLPAYSGAQTKEAVLLEIYRNRCTELFMSGMKLEDSRRFGRPGPGDANPERNRNFYPYPNIERDNNPNTPADPTN